MDAAISLPAEPRSARAARRFVTECLAGADGDQWEMPAQLLITELVTNAILHARTEMTVTVTVEADGCRLRVRDLSNRLPARRNYSDDATTGRGLALVERISSEWGVEEHEDGKTVWAKIGEVDWTALFEAESDFGGADSEPAQESRTSTTIGA